MTWKSFNGNKNAGWAKEVQNKLARNVWICTDFKLNDRVENCDCKEIAKFRITTQNKYPMCLLAFVQNVFVALDKVTMRTIVLIQSHLPGTSFAFLARLTPLSVDCFVLAQISQKQRGEDGFTCTGIASHTTYRKKTLQRCCFLSIGLPYHRLWYKYNQKLTITIL